MRFRHLAIAAVLAVVPVCVTYAEQHTSGVPALSSRPGAPYTVYLDVAGFNYNGQWGGKTPGVTPAYADRAANSTFSTAEQGEIRDIWSRVGQSYINFNVNVTTVDPAVGLSTDAMRQTFYDNQPRFMHTIIGSQLRTGVEWYSNQADGVSQLGVVANAATTSGDHTNWMFTELAVGDGNYIGAVSAHENGHAFNLLHQSDYTGNTLMAEYSLGDAPTNTGSGSYVAIMGQADGTQRVTWRSGDANTGQAGHSQNDVAKMLASNAGLALVEDGIGHTRLLASPLPLTGNAVNSSLAKGTISPLSMSNPNPVGAANYTEDWFLFASDGVSPISLTCTDSTSFLVSGVADGVGTLRSKLFIYNFAGTLLATATEAGNTLSETYTGLLPAGNYYAQIASAGGHAQNAPAFNAANYYDMGAYFLTGSGLVPVPEPAGLGGLFVFGGIVILRCRHRRS